MSKEKLLKQEKGSITAFAIATVFTLIFILGGVFTASTVTRKNQLRTLLKIKEIYAKVPKLTENVQKPIDTVTSYVGYYADIEGDGVVDGIIYVDLAKGKTATGNWGDSNGSYEIEAVTTGLKEYTISNKTYEGQTVAGIYKANDGFGEKQVITPVKESSGTERFYIMALEDVQLAHPYSETSNTAYWYYNAWDSTNTKGLMTDYATYTSLKFGKGEENTKKMIARWKKTNTTEVPNATEVDYGTQNEKDLWGQIDTEVAKGWYIPSKEEWSVFGQELGITKENYVGRGLSDCYWSSSQYDTSYAWYANFGDGYMSYGSVYNGGYVRLCATF